MMKKTAAVLVLTAAFVFLFTAAALAGPTNPKRQKMVEMLRIERELKSKAGTKSIRSVNRAEASVSVGISGSLTAGETVTFTATLRGIEDTEGLEYQWGIHDEGRDPNGFTYLSDQDGLTTQYTFYSAGSYSYTFFVIRDGTVIAWTYGDFTVDGDQTIEKKVASVVSSCRASTEWQTALNLYDWLTHHAYYDNTYSFYGPDMLFRGYGVCDSYSKAYVLLCQAAGITIERATGSGHAWNTLMIDGKWYQADPTWDDPAGAEVLVSGMEGHEFFCLNSDLMQGYGGHDIETGAHAASCTSLDANYYIHTGEWQKWGLVRDYPKVDLFSDLLAESFNRGDVNCVFNADNSYEGFFQVERDGSPDWIYAGNMLDKLLVYAIENYGVTLPDGGPVSVDGERTDDSLSFSLMGWRIPETGTIDVPGDVEAVEEQAFQGVGATSVRLSANCRTVGSGTFANSKIRTVYVLSSDIQIADDAFSGCERLIFVTDNESAVQYAADHDYLVIAP